MKIAPRRFYSINCFFLAVCGLLLVGCLNPFAPAETDNIGLSSGLLTNQETPEAVLKNLKYAYTFKDSLVYSDLFDSTFIFRSWDFNVSPPVPIQWGRDVELRTTARMFHFFRNLDLNWNATLFLNFDSTGRKAEMKRTFTLTLDGGQQIPTLNGEVIFKFIRKGDRWFITFWEDLRI